MSVQELLVHISAPSSNRDDQRYKEVAYAYQHFRAASTFQLARYDANVANTSPAASAKHTQDTACDTAALESQLLTSSLVESSPHDSPLSETPDKAHLYQSPNGSNDGDVQQSSQERVPDSCAPRQPSNSYNSSSSQPQALQEQLRQDTFEPSSSQNQADTILPPDPSVDLSSSPKTFVTPKLQQLAQLLDIHTRYKPVVTARQLESSERGHWRIDTSAWPFKLYNQFWSYLQDFVGSGAAGCGVLCFRISTSKMATRNNIVRIYCWGEVVAHIYLLAFVASESRVRQTKPVWIDAQAQTVIEMP